MSLLKKIFHRKTRSESAMDIYWPRRAPVEDDVYVGYGDMDCCDVTSGNYTPSGSQAGFTSDSSDSSMAMSSALVERNPKVLALQERLRHLETANGRMKTDISSYKLKKKRALKTCPSVTFKTKTQSLQRQLDQTKRTLKRRTGSIGPSARAIYSMLTALSQGRAPQHGLLAYIKRSARRDPSSIWQLVLRDPPLLGARHTIHVNTHALLWFMSRRKEQFRKSRSVYWRREIHPLDYVIAPSPSSLSSIFEVLSQDRQDALNRLFEKRRRGLKAVVRDPVLTSNSSATSVVTIMPTFRSRPPTTPTHASYRLKAGPSSGSVSILVSDASAYSGIASCSSYADSVYSGIYKGLSRSQDVCLSIPASASGARSSAIPRSSTSRRSLVQAANVQLGAIDEERLSVSPEQMRNEFEGDMDSPGQDLKIRRIPSFDAPLMHSTPISRPLVSSTPIIPDDPICASPAPVRDKSDSSLPSTPLAPISNSNSNKTLSSLSSPIPDRNKLSSPPLPTGNRLGSPSRKIPSKQLSSPSSATPDKSTGSLRLAPPSRLPVLKARKSTCSIRPE